MNDIIYQIIQQRTRHFAWLLERFHKVPYCCVAGMYKTWYSQHRNERQNQTNYTWKWHLSFICGSIELVFSDGTMKDSSESEARITEWMRTTWCHFLALISHIFCFFFSYFHLYFVIQIGNSTPLMTLPSSHFISTTKIAWNARARSYTMSICSYPHRKYWNETEIWVFFSSPFSICKWIEFH